MKAAIGLEYLAQNITEFIHLGEGYVRDACQGRSTVHCMYERSCIKRPEEEAFLDLDCICLALDVGGTHTKAALGMFRPGSAASWRMLFDLANEALLPESTTELPIYAFARELAQRARASLEQLGVPISSVESVALVWSNQLESVVFDNGRTRGVTGLVTGLQAGTYRKSEWFVRGLHDGFNLGELILSSLMERDILPKVFVVGNDTVFTLTALPGAHAGVVASSGGNCTLLGTSGADEDFIFNSEIGSLLKVPEHLLSEGDQALQRATGTAIAFEDILAGKWLPRLLEEHVIALSNHSGSSLRALAAALVGQELRFDMNDVRIIAGVEPLPALLRPLLLTGDAAEGELRELGRALVGRAGVAAGALCYFSTFNQIVAGRGAVTIALDSAMARYVPGYFSSLSEAFRVLLEKRGVSGAVTLMQPLKSLEGGDISVPLRGAALAGALWK
jgi:hypothetical protein